jgi:glycosyltransferase involved in cell wall biosynthesis
LFVIEVLQCTRIIAVMEMELLEEPLIEDLPAVQRTLRIALVTETYPPEVNGVAMSVSRLVQGLHARNHALQLIRPRQGKTQQPRDSERLNEVLTHGWPIPLYPTLRIGVPSKRTLVRHWSLWRPDVVHIATEGPLGWSALQAARHLSVPVTSDFRTNFHAYGQHYRVGWLARPIMSYLRMFHNHAHCTMAPTDALRDKLNEAGFERLVVVGRGVDVELFDPSKRSATLREQWGARDGDLVALCVSRLAPEKNLRLVVAGFEAMRTQCPGAKLVFVGEGPQREALQQLCPEAHFAGQRSGEDLAAHYASADVFLFPSLTETFGNVTTEALASGVPVVAFDCAAAAQLIASGHNGVLVRGEDDAAYIQAVVEATAQPERLRQWRQAARESVRHLDWREVVERFESILMSAIDDNALNAATRAAWRRQVA